MMILGIFPHFKIKLFVYLMHILPLYVAYCLVMGECRVYELAHALFLSLYMYQYHLKIIPYLITDSSILMIVPNFIS